MNTRIISYFTAVAFAITSVPGRADVTEEVQHELITAKISPSVASTIDANQAQASTDTPAVADAVDSDVDDDYSPPKGKEVTQADDANQKSARRQMWINIGLAVTAVIVAVVALVLVSNNNGHHHSSK